MKIWGWLWTVTSEEHCLVWFLSPHIHGGPEKGGESVTGLTAGRGLQNFPAWLASRESARTWTKQRSLCTFAHAPASCTSYAVFCLLTSFVILAGETIDPLKHWGYYTYIHHLLQIQNVRRFLHRVYLCVSCLRMHGEFHQEIGPCNGDKSCFLQSRNCIFYYYFNEFQASRGW
jgi:hypothetical protein